MLDSGIGKERGQRLLLFSIEIILMKFMNKMMEEASLLRAEEEESEPVELMAEAK